MGRHLVAARSPALQRQRPHHQRLEERAADAVGEVEPERDARATVHRQDPLVGRRPQVAGGHVGVPHADPVGQLDRALTDRLVHLVAGQLPAGEQRRAPLDRLEADVGPSEEAVHALQGDRLPRRRRPGRAVGGRELGVDAARHRPDPEDLAAEAERPGERDVAVALGAVVVAGREDLAQPRRHDGGAAVPEQVAAPVRRQPRRVEPVQPLVGLVGDRAADRRLVRVDHVRPQLVDHPGEMRDAAVDALPVVRVRHDRDLVPDLDVRAIGVDRHRPGEVGVRIRRGRHVEDVQLPIAPAQQVEVAGDMDAGGEADQQQAWSTRARRAGRCCRVPAQGMRGTHRS